MENGLLYYRGKIYVPGPDLRHKISALCHDSKLAGHPRRWKTLELVLQNYWWPQMSRYIGKYVSTCNMCLQIKSIHQPPSGELHPLPILDAPWDTASVNFITELPESNRKDAIMVVVNSGVILLVQSLLYQLPGLHNSASTTYGNITDYLRKWVCKGSTDT